MTSGTWQASGNYLEPTHASNWNGIKQSTTDADNEVRLRYRINDTSNGSAALVVRGRYVDDNNLVQVVVRPGSVALEQIASGTPATLDTESAASTQDAWYNLRIESDGAGVTVWRWADGELETKVLETASASVTTANAVMLGADAAFAVDFDDVRILADGLSNTTTFAVNNANELTSMADRNGSTTFGFDAWGRMTSKARGSYTAAYGYRYGQMLCSVDSDFPGEGDVTYEYGEDGKRRTTTIGAGTIAYAWGVGTQAITEEDASGTLTRMHVSRFADVIGSDPSSGTTRYYSLDQLGSTRALRDQSAGLLGEYEYGPYGIAYGHADVSLAMRGFSGMRADPLTGLYYTRFRMYNPHTGSWTTRDPAGPYGPNLYEFALASPLVYVDPWGLLPFPRPIDDDWWSDYLDPDADIPNSPRDALEKRRRDCEKRVFEQIDKLRSMNAMNPACYIPSDLQVSFGGLPGGYSFSPWSNWIDINYDACDLSDSALRRHLLHEIGHAIEYNPCWRIPYVPSFWWNDGDVYGPFPDSYAGKCEQRADDFAEGCRY